MNRDKRASNRVYVLIAVMSLWAAAIGIRLYFLHVVRSDDFRQMAGRQQQRTVEITPRRGVIYDRNGNELAISIKVDSVFAVPGEVKDPVRTAKVLSGLTGVPRAELLAKFNSEGFFKWIKRKISSQEAAAIMRAKLPGIHLEKENRRFYPKSAMAAHVLGYVNLDEEGMAGLEYRYNESVQGEPGKVVISLDARQTTYDRLEVTEPAQAGANLITTIDENIQHFVEKELDATAARTHAAGISVVVMDPRTGEILAMANRPSFNPNEYFKFNERSWVNWAVSHTFEPGSTFKIVTAAAALEENLTTPDEIIDCQMGSIVLFGHRIRDHRPFGRLSVREILQHSSDVGAIKLGLRLGNERFASHISTMGFGRPSGIDLPGEERGQTKPASRWSRVSVGAISMGQEIAVTPIQVLSLVSAVANGGILYRPHVVRRVEHPQRGILAEAQPSGERVMSATVAVQLQNMLEEVMTEGTAKSSKLSGYRAAGKTGTAQKIDETGRYSATKHIASFAGFAPVSNPMVSIIVVVDEPVGAYHGGDVAAPIFKRIAEHILRVKTVAPDIPEYRPRYMGKPEKRKPLQLAPAPSAPQPEWKVVEASYTNDALADEGYTLGDITVPDFYGKSLRQVTEESLRLSLKLKSVGSGKGTMQFPPAGSRVESGARVQVQFSTR